MWCRKPLLFIKDTHNDVGNATLRQIDVILNPFRVKDPA